jgi:hypothetical protein
MFLTGKYSSGVDLSYIIIVKLLKMFGFNHNYYKSRTKANLCVVNSVKSFTRTMHQN